VSFVKLNVVMLSSVVPLERHSKVINYTPRNVICDVTERASLMIVTYDCYLKLKYVYTGCHCISSSGWH
jgi:hypothetical protein